MKINIHEYPIGATPLELARYQVAVMEASETGAVVEFTRNWEDYEWEEIKTPSWDWTDSSYRIKPSVIAKGSNPKNLTEEKVGVKDGWRLLTKEECEVRMIILKNHNDIQMLTKDEWMTGDGYGYYGNCVDESYRTKRPEGYFLQYSKPAIGHNPDNLTDDIVGVTGGWRLLSTDELKNIISSKIYFIDGWWNPQNKKWEYGKIDTICFSSQYRTKTGVGFYLPKKLGYIPWTLETAPKGLIFVKNRADDNITMVVSWYDEGVMANGKYVTYLELLNCMYSTDNCVNWSKCGFYAKV